MKHVKEHEVEGERFPPPHARVIKHLVAPWTLGATRFWAGVTIIEEGSSSNPHLHDDGEEIFYVISGAGRVKVGEEEEDIGPGSCIFIPPKTLHQLLNTGNIELKVLAVTSPPFTVIGFKETHRVK
jgi:mannose-6-phosphate isomerase-like protein (cupin superfamily)